MGVSDGSSQAVGWPWVLTTLLPGYCRCSLPWPPYPTLLSLPTRPTLDIVSIKAACYVQALCVDPVHTLCAVWTLCDVWGRCVDPMCCVDLMPCVDPMHALCAVWTLCTPYALCGPYARPLCEGARLSASLVVVVV